MWLIVIFESLKAPKIRWPKLLKWPNYSCNKKTPGSPTYIVSVDKRYTGRTDRQTDIMRCNYPPMLCMVRVKNEMWWAAQKCSLCLLQILWGKFLPKVSKVKWHLTNISLKQAGRRRGSRLLATAVLRTDSRRKDADSHIRAVWQQESLIACSSRMPIKGWLFSNTQCKHSMLIFCIRHIHRRTSIMRRPNADEHTDANGFMLRLTLCSSNRTVKKLPGNNRT